MNNGEYIRDYYRVPARVGGRITYGPDKEPATIVGFSDQYLRVEFDRWPHSVCILHPTSSVDYIEATP